jgi:hypothetical protein
METPKKKAFKLAQKFKPFTYGYAIDACKGMALIAVEEIINAFDLYGNDLMGEINYWQEVKQELEKL